MFLSPLIFWRTTPRSTRNPRTFVTAAVRAAAGHVHRPGGDPQRVAAAAHAADVADQRHFRHRGGGVDRAGRQAGNELHHDTRLDGRGRLDDQHRQRLSASPTACSRCSRSGSRQVMNMDIVIQILYLICVSAAVHPFAEVDEPPQHGPARHRFRRGGDGGWPSAARCYCPDIELSLDRRRRSWSAASCGVPLAMVPLTAVPQRTALSHAFGGLAAGPGGSRGVLSVAIDCIPTNCPHVLHRRPGGRSHPRLPDLHRQSDGRRQAPGDRSPRGRSPTRAKTPSTSRCWASPSSAACCWCGIRRGGCSFPSSCCSRWPSACC